MPTTPEQQDDSSILAQTQIQIQAQEQEQEQLSSEDNNMSDIITTNSNDPVLPSVKTDSFDHSTVLSIQPSQGHSSSYVLDSFNYDSDVASYDAEFNVEFEPPKHKFDIISFDTPTTKANLHYYFPHTSRAQAKRNVALYLMAIFLGFVVAIAGVAIEQGVRGVTTGLYTLSQVTLMQKHNDMVGAAFSFVGLALVFVVISSSLVVFVSPLAAGSGIPEIKAYLNGVLIPGLTKLRTGIAKGIGVMFSIGGGLICGKEGPMIHVGGLLGAAVSQAASKVFKFRLKYKFLDQFRTEAMKRDFISVGAAVGITVAFQAPLGGLLFIVEEAATHWNQQMSWTTLLCASIAAIFAGIITQMCHGHFQFWNFDYAIYSPLEGISGGFPYYMKDLPFQLFTGLICGLYGALLPLIQRPLTLFRFTYINKPFRRLSEAMSIAIITNTLRVTLPLIQAHCTIMSEEVQHMADQAELWYGQYDCPDGSYNTLATLIYNPTTSVVRSLGRITNPTEFSAWEVFLGLAFFGILLIVTYGIAVPSGLFIPSFAIGCLTGRLVGLMVHSFWKRSDFHISSYVFIGAVAGLAGTTRMVFSVVVIAMEASASANGVIPALLTAFVAKFTADALCIGIYDLHINLKGMPYLENEVVRPDLYYSTFVRDVMSRNMTAIYSVMRVKDLVAILRKYSFNGFPVVKKIIEDNVNDAHMGKHPHRRHKLWDSSAQLRRRRGIPEGAYVNAHHTRTASAPDIDISDCLTNPGVNHRENVNGSATSDVFSLNDSQQLGSEMGAETTPGPGANNLNHFVTGAPLNSQVDFRTHTLHGTISRRVLLAILDRLDNYFEDVENGRIFRREYYDSAWPNYNHGRNENNIMDKIREDQMNRLVNVEDLINRNPVTISDRATCAEAKSLFRSTGTRHAFVLHLKSGVLVGIITRKDILEESLESVKKYRKHYIDESKLDTEEHES